MKNVTKTLPGVRYLGDKGGKHTEAVIDLEQWGELWEKVSALMMAQARKHPTEQDGQSLETGEDAEMSGTLQLFSYDDYVKGIRHLSIAEQLSLIELISANVKMSIPQKNRQAKTKLARLKRRDTIVGDPEELVEMQVWEWHEPENLSSM